MHQYPYLYCIARRKNKIVTHVLNTRPLNISFRRALVGDRLRLLLELVTKIMSVELGDQDDSFIWCLTKHAFFTVKSMYSDLMKIGYLPDRCVASGLKIPLKIKNFVVFKKKVILTKEILQNEIRKVILNVAFVALMRLYSIYFFDCHVARFVWNVVCVVFDIQPPTIMSSLFGSWLEIFSRKIQK